MFLAPRDPGIGHRTDPAAIGEGDGIGPCEGPERGEPMIGPLLELTGARAAPPPDPAR